MSDLSPASLLALLARTFVIGIAVAAPVGAMGVLCIQRTLSGGWRRGMLTGFGIASADGIYAGVAAFGVSALAASLVAWQTPLRVVGGIALVVLGVRAALQPPTSYPAEKRGASAADAPEGAVTDDELGRAAAVRLYTSAVGLTLTNPMTIMAFGAIFASAGLGAQPTPLSAAVATAGVALGSLAWWTGLVSVVAYTRHRIGASVLAKLNRISGAVIVLFGLAALASVVLG